jgi:hypothetical protein
VTAGAPVPDPRMTLRQRCEALFASADRRRLRPLFDGFEERGGNFRALTDHLVSMYFDRLMPTVTKDTAVARKKRARLVQKLEEAADDLIRHERTSSYWFYADRHAEVLSAAIAALREDPVANFRGNRNHRPKVAQGDAVLTQVFGRDPARRIVAALRRSVAAGFPPG